MDNDWSANPRILTFAEKTQQLLGELDSEMVNFDHLNNSNQLPLRRAMESKIIPIRSKTERNLLREWRNVLTHSGREIRVDGVLLVTDKKQSPERIYVMTQKDLRFLGDAFRAFRHVGTSGEIQITIKCSVCNTLGDASLPLMCGHILYSAEDLSQWKYPLAHKPANTTLKGEGQFWFPRKKDAQKEHERKLKALLHDYNNE